MAYISTEDELEKVASIHAKQHWRRRELELAHWVKRSKPRKRNKQTVILGNVEIDAELPGSLALFKRMQIQTEFSCAGVSLLDEPEDHLIYAYISYISSDKTERFVQLAMKLLKHRFLVTFERRGIFLQ